jgi:protease I
MTKKILVLVDEKAEDLELWYPIYRLQEEGFIVHMAGEEAGVNYHGKYGVPYTSDVSWKEITCEQYDGLLIPGGWAPDKIRRFDVVKSLVKAFDESGKPIGQICHAGWVSISSGIIHGRKVTSTPGIMDDMINAGGIWLNEAVVVDKNLVSSRWPKDLPEYVKAFIELF